MSSLFGIVCDCSHFNDAASPRQIEVACNAASESFWHALRIDNSWKSIQIGAEIRYQIHHFFMVVAEFDKVNFTSCLCVLFLQKSADILLRLIYPVKQLWIFFTGSLKVVHIKVDVPFFALNTHLMDIVSEKSRASLWYRTSHPIFVHQTHTRHLSHSGYAFILFQILRR